jgi:hypothetical protein
MSHSDEVYKDHITRHDPKEGFDSTEPDSKSIWGFTIGSVVLLVLTLVALQFYFEDIYQKAVAEKVLLPPSAQLQELRSRDSYNLTHYMYGNLDKSSGRIRVPVARAMELYAQEAQAGKLFYPAKPTAPKKEEPAAPVVAAPATRE